MRTVPTHSHYFHRQRPRESRPKSLPLRFSRRVQRFNVHLSLSLSRTYAFFSIRFQSTTILFVIDGRDDTGGVHVGWPGMSLVLVTWGSRSYVLSAGASTNTLYNKGSNYKTVAGESFSFHELRYFGFSRYILLFFRYIKL